MGACSMYSLATVQDENVDDVHVPCADSLAHGVVAKVVGGLGGCPVVEQQPHTLLSGGAFPGSCDNSFEPGTGEAARPWAAVGVQAAVQLCQRHCMCGWREALTGIPHLSTPETPNATATATCKPLPNLPHTHYVASVAGKHQSCAAIHVSAVWRELARQDALQHVIVATLEQRAVAHGTCEL